jgi:hypothetical protein
MRPFVAFALPRSRTAWISRFLSYCDWQCGHDEIRHCRSLDDVASWFGQPCTGTVETAAAPFWRLLERFGDVGVVVVRRPVADVVTSLRAAAPGCFDAPAVTVAMQRLDRKLEQIGCRVPGALSLTFEELGTEAGCRRLWEHCLPYPFDAAWHAMLAPVNIQINMGLLLRYYAAHQPQLTKLAKLAEHRIIAGMRQPEREFDGMTFQHEPFREFYRDAGPLFAEHLVQTGQAPDDHARKNLALLQKLDDIGALQTMTARANGRMFGYLMSIIAPSLDAPGRIVGEHTIFFASRDVRGLGMRLQRAALDALRARGVHEVIMRAGHRGSGPRLGTFYRRLGADEFGQLYRLEIA